MTRCLFVAAGNSQFQQKEDSTMSIAENVAKVRAQIDAAAIACGRDPK